MKIVATIATIIATLIYIISTYLFINDPIGRSTKPGIHLYNFFLWYTIPIILWIVYFIMNEIKKNNIKIPIFTDKNVKINTNTYYIQENGATSEPLTYNQLKAKNIKKYTYVWRKGIDWTEAGDLRELKQLFEHDGPPVFNKDRLKKNKKSDVFSEIEIIPLIFIIIFFCGLIYSFLINIGVKL